MKYRESGVELLRILAMMMVLAIHANYWRIGCPSAADMEAGGQLAVFVRIWCQMLCSPCVDVFVIISGYFAIRPKIKSMVNLWFLLAFWGFVSDVLYPCCIAGQFNLLKALCHIIFPFFGWFIPAYLGLYLISPVLNGYVESCKASSLTKFLIFSFSVQFFFDIIYPRWSIFGRTIFNSGYSVLSFSLLYLLGRALRLYWMSSLGRIRAFNWFGLYFAMFTGWTIIQFVLLGANFHGIIGEIAAYIVKRGAAYTNPIVIIGSLFLFMAFKSMKFGSRFVNHIAASVLGCFCFHSMPFYSTFVKTIYNNYNGISVLLLDLAFIICVFSIGIAIDQLRILIWRAISHE